MGGYEVEGGSRMILLCPTLFYRDSPTFGYNQSRGRRISFKAYLSFLSLYVYIQTVSLRDRWALNENINSNQKIVED